MLSTAQDTARIVSRAESIPDTLLFKIQKAQSVISELKSANKKRFGIERIRTGLADVKANVDPVAADVLTNGKTIDAKSLSNYGLILNGALGKLTDWRTVLSKSNNDLQNTLNQVLALSSDSLLTVAGNDTTEKKLYADQLGNLKVQLQEAGTRTSAQLDSVSRLLADVSGTYLRVSNVQANINERLQKSTESAFQRESPFLWNAPASLNVNQLGTAFTSSFQGQDQILRYFFTSNWDDRFLLLLVAGLFFVWVFTNLKKANEPVLRQKLGPIHVDALRPVPVVASLLVLLNLTPLFEPNSPSLYVEITQFLLLAILTVQLWTRFSRHDKWMWSLTAALFITLIVINATVSVSVFMRLGLMALNAAFLYVGFVFFHQFPHRHISKRILGPVSKLCLALQVLAILLNIFGRITLAKTFTITAVVGLIQLTSLGVFIEIVLEALELQIKISACSEGLFSRVNVNHTRRSFKKGLAFVAISLWLLVFFINLGVADSLFNLAYQFLSRPRSFGSISFTLSNVLSFSVIIYLSSLLQRNIGLLFGESQLPNADDNESVGQISSVLALVRLVIIIAGLLLAIAASGVSIDKFTVVLGALSVGIGLGMQNIVSNFVSGIILIFEKPFQIGDYVELADRKGRIQTIGIRSSKMVTIQGSEVIIPNSDLLSNRLVNWTSGETYLKTELTLKLSADTDLQAVRQLITDEVSKLEAAIVNKAPEILLTAISADSVELKVLVFIRSIYAEAGIKSQLLQHLLAKFREENVKIM
ncbi:mechanosensitive ion channel family protein [Spirosoma agri]|uniref:mechanosensitive ion channel family protein n=1 Tax=Spirosoma agri TaxID=1987381 RepID=UPI00293BA310|nr:mechanosensitive ion channel domain-containing protein [Spirosoma agri]